MREMDELGGALGMARMLTLQGKLDEAERAVDSADRRFRQLGDRFLVAEANAVRADIRNAAGRETEAAALHRAGFDGKIALGDQAFASTSAVELSRALSEIGELDEALHFAEVALDTSASDDIASQGGGRAAKARALSRLGRHEEAVSVGRDGVAILARTDYLTYHADALMDLAQALRAAGQADEATTAAREAMELYRRKGATLPLERTEQLIKDWAA
jgi:tetratricopeptide (TPR) repeat protein